MLSTNNEIPVQSMEDKNISELDQVTDNDISEEDLSENNNLEFAEGVQDLESVDLLAASDNSVEDKSQAQNMISENNTLTQGDSDLEDLGEEFSGEVLDLEEISSKKLIPVYNDESMEMNNEKVVKKYLI